MVGTRHLQGTIISRVGYLLESGSLKKAPLWYNVVKRFPPPKTSLLSLVAKTDQTEIPKITYEIDDIKREFHQKFDRAIRDPESLFTDITVEETKTEMFLKDYSKFIERGCSHEEAMEQASTIFVAHLQSLRDKSKQSVSRNAMKEHTELKSDTTEADLDSTDIFDMFRRQHKKND